MGEVLIGGTAALLICMFLAPRFIEALRNREFGQHIREEGPEGHHVKAGTPTMAAQPPARPSSPSVRLTALVVPATTR